MSNLRDIRRRLKSVENIKKITDAMERVAAARLRRAQSLVEESRPYIVKMREILANLASGDFKHPLMDQREVKKTGLIVIAADRGLSGSHNSNILQAADKFLKNYTPENLELILIGRKCFEYFQQRRWPIKYQLADWGGKISFHDIKALSNQLIHWYLEHEFDEIWIIYTHFISIAHRQVLTEKFLNIGPPKEAKKTDKKAVYSNYIFEPSPEAIFAELLPRYCLTIIQTSLYESYVSELAARIMAMQIASKNSEEMIENLTLVRNRVRQESITREMLEISAGSQS